MKGEGFLRERNSENQKVVHRVKPSEVRMRSESWWVTEKAGEVVMGQITKHLVRQPKRHSVSP